ncbi:hypothetical protein NNC19_17830 [Clostridium sp. SHJSY1]|uniref:hypothetical protein n=1 Tax=Clostridium sp. SHJSY1 TaxID=2942483 RepID=UPI0028751A5D|nr:hypothetical protein [Clostridium sp. SHJSY1]MDS0527554.1 hypothetical protein [Clostridium sp. SHJSY1]
MKYYKYNSVNLKVTKNIFIRGLLSILEMCLNKDKKYITCQSKGSNAITCRSLTKEVFDVINVAGDMDCVCRN